MPIYEFVCTECKNNFEKLVKNSKQKVPCPKCGSKKVEKKFSAFGMKVGDNFTSSVSSGCASCNPAPGACSSCSSKK